MNVTLFGKRAFADVIRLTQDEIILLYPVGTKSNDKSPYENTQIRRGGRHAKMETE